MERSTRPRRGLFSWRNPFIAAALGGFALFAASVLLETNAGGVLQRAFVGVFVAAPCWMAVLWIAARVVGQLPPDHPYRALLEGNANAAAIVLGSYAVGAAVLLAGVFGGFF